MNPLISIGTGVLEVLFFVGWIGSLLVVVLSLIDFTNPRDDEDDSSEPEPPATQEVDV